MSTPPTPFDRNVRALRAALVAGSGFFATAVLLTIGHLSTTPEISEHLLPRSVHVGLEIFTWLLTMLIYGIASLYGMIVAWIYVQSKPSLEDLFSDPSGPPDA